MCDLIEIPVRKRMFCGGAGSISVGEPIDVGDFEERMESLLEVIREVESENEVTV